MKELHEATPSSLAHLIGMREVVSQVSVGIEAAFADNMKFDDSLLVGNAGCGKTQTAKVIAAEMASGFQEVLGQAISSSADLNSLLLSATERSVCLIDEAHELPKEQQTALFLALDQRRIAIGGGKGGRSSQSIDIANFTLLLATTDEYALLPPLRDRMKLTLRFGFYTDDELAILTRQRSRGLGWVTDDDVFPQIAKRARGTPRLALRLLQAARRVCRAEGDEDITLTHLERACVLENIDVLGLGSIEQQYLAMLSDGASRLNVIASRLGLPARTVCHVTEPILIRLGLVDKDEQGRRVVTAKGREHLHHRIRGV